MQNPTHDLASFDFLTAGHIRFGRGTADVHIEDVARFGRRVLLVRGNSVPWVDKFSERLSECGCTVVPVFGRGEPTVTDVEVATALGREAKADVVVTTGGGAVIDLGKAAAAMIPSQGNLMDHLEGVGGGRPFDESPLPCVAIPTTAGTGSEVTRNAVIGVPEAGRKVSLRDDRILPRMAIVDPSLTDRTPSSVTFSSGLDAVTQVIEPYLSNRANPLTDALCRAAIPLGLAALARLAKTEDCHARDQIAYVSLIGGLALTNAGLGAVHGLAGVIGGRFAAPHGLICGRLLGPVLLQNRKAEHAANARMDRYTEIENWMASAFDLPAGSAFEALPGWLDARALPGLKDWIDPSVDIDAIAAEAATSSSMKANPNVLASAALISAILQAL